MKKTFIISIILIVTIFVSYVVAAFLGAFIPNGKSGGGSGDIEVHLVSGPIHFDVLIPATPVTLETFSFLEDAGVPISMTGVEWILVGWGARGFYIETKNFSDMKVRTVAQAVFGDAAVMHFAAVGNIDKIKTEKLLLSAPEYEALLSNLMGELQSFDAIENAGYTNTDAFFSAKGHFNIFRTCNVWLAKVFRDTGLRFGVWTPVPLSIALSHQRFQTH